LYARAAQFRQVLNSPIPSDRASVSGRIIGIVNIKIVIILRKTSMTLEVRNC
jgi:hypothetical protein